MRKEVINIIYLDDVTLYNAIITEGEELYTSQDGCYAEYKYNDDVYILEMIDGIVSICMKGE